MSTKRFKDLIGKDIFGAFMAFVEGSKRGGEGAISFANVLKDAELTGAGANEIISKLASNSDLVSTKIKLAGDNIDGTGSILAEFSKKNFELAKDMKTLGEIANSFTQSKFLENLFSGGIHGIVSFWNWLKTLAAFLGNNSWAATAFVYALTAMNLGLVRATLSAVINTTAMIANRIAYEVGYRWLLLSETATKAWAFATSAASVKTKIATALQWLWNAAISANPLGALITLIAGAIAAMQLYSANNAEAIRIERERTRLSNDLKMANENLKISQEDLNKQLQNYNRMSVEEREGLRKIIALKKAEAFSRLQNFKARQLEAAKSAADLTFMEKAWNFIKAGGNNTLAVINDATNSAEKYTEAFNEFKDPIDQLNESYKALDASLNSVDERLNAYANAMKITGDTTDALREKQNLLQSALDGTRKGSAEYAKISAEMAKVNRLLGGTAMPGKKEKKHAKTQEEKDAENLNKALEDARKDNYHGTLTAREKELAVHEEKYQKMKDLAHGNAEKLKEIKDEEGKALVNLTAKWAEEDKKTAVEKTKEKWEALQQQLAEQNQAEIDAIDLKIAKGELDGPGGDALKLQQEEEFLTAQYMLRSALGLKTNELEHQLTRNFIEQQQLKRDTTLKLNQDVKDSERELHDAKRELLSAGIGLLRGFLKDGSALSKAAFIAEKALAIASVVIKTQAEIAAIRVATAEQIAWASSNPFTIATVP
ncbi:MAG: hypothetical protein WBP45_02140, partial [Daejeonella sp.]